MDLLHYKIQVTHKRQPISVTEAHTVESHITAIFNYGLIILLSNAAR